jgi:hypothetical protein
MSEGNTYSKSHYIIQIVKLLKPAGYVMHHQFNI